MGCVCSALHPVKGHRTGLHEQGHWPKDELTCRVHLRSQAGWLDLISALGQLRQEDDQLEANLGYTERNREGRGEWQEGGGGEREPKDKQKNPKFLINMVFMATVSQLTYNATAEDIWCQWKPFPRRWMCLNTRSPAGGTVLRCCKAIELEGKACAGWSLEAGL